MTDKEYLLVKGIMDNTISGVIKWKFRSNTGDRYYVDGSYKGSDFSVHLVVDGKGNVKKREGLISINNSGFSKTIVICDNLFNSGGINKSDDALWNLQVILFDTYIKPVFVYKDDDSVMDGLINDLGIVGIRDNKIEQILGVGDKVEQILDVGDKDNVNGDIKFIVGSSSFNGFGNKVDKDGGFSLFNFLCGVVIGVLVCLFILYVIL
jgi:hypothetical protein